MVFSGWRAKHRFPNFRTPRPHPRAVSDATALYGPPQTQWCNICPPLPIICPHSSPFSSSRLGFWGRGSNFAPASLRSAGAEKTREQTNFAIQRRPTTMIVPLALSPLCGSGWPFGPGLGCLAAFGLPTCGPQVDLLGSYNWVIVPGHSPQKGSSTVVPGPLPGAQHGL